MWAAAETGVDAVSGSDVDRDSIAKDLAAAHIHLSSIQPTHLIGTVRESGLVDNTVISEALEAHALLAEKDFGLQVSKKRNKTLGVTVFGAGAVAVNGYYEYDGEHEGYPKYTKKCLWQGEATTFYIYRYYGRRTSRWAAFEEFPEGDANLSATCVWYISSSIEKTGESLSGDQFYRVLDQECLPIDGWETEYLDFEPCPCLRLSPKH